MTVDIGLGSAAASRWWEAPKYDLPNQVTNNAKYLQRRQVARLESLAMLEQLYQIRSVESLPDLMAALPGRVSMNIIKSCVDTVKARMSKNSPAPYPQTSGADYHTQRRAKKLRQFLEGVFHEARAYEVGLECFRDAEIWGTGACKVFVGPDGKVHHERVPIANLFVDEVEAKWGFPRQLFEVRMADRASCIDAFGRKDALKDAPSVTSENPLEVRPQSISDNLRVYEAWRRPSGPEAKDGRHVICTEQEVLLDKPWERDHFPFAFMRWSPPVQGFWGVGIAESLVNLQLECNLLCIGVSTAQYNGLARWIFVEEDSDVDPDAFTNDPAGGIIKYHGTAPVVVAPSIVNPEIYEQIERLRERAFAQEGISTLSASAQKPAGLNSGVAIRESQDVENDRMGAVAKAYEQSYVDVGRLSLEAAQDAAEERRGKSYVVRSPGNRFLDSVDLKDAVLPADEFVLKIFPVSQLPQQPSAKLQTVQEYVQGGFMSARQAKRLLAMPDLEAWQEHDSAAEEWIEFVIGRIVDEGIYGAEEAPDELDDLALIIEMTRAEVLIGKRSGLEVERLDLLRRYAQDALDLQMQLQPPALSMGAGAPQMPGQAPGPGAPGAPQARPMLAPTSDMLPQVQ